MCYLRVLKSVETTQMLPYFIHVQLTIDEHVTCKELTK